jgi:mannosyltransferase
MAAICHRHEMESILWYILSGWRGVRRGPVDGGGRLIDVKVHTEIAPAPSPSDAPSSQVTDRVGAWIVVGIAVVASVGLVPWLNNSLFADEGATLYSAGLSWSNLWAQSLHVDLVLLPYYVLVHGWMLVSGSVAWIRTLSLLAYFGTVVVAGWLGLRIAGRWCGIGTAALTAGSTLLVQKALNARPYELSAFFVVLCAVVLFRWLEDGRVRWMWWFGLLALVVTAMQLFSLLAPVSMLVCALAVRPELFRQRIRDLMAPLGVTAVLVAAWVVACSRELGQVNWIAGESTGTRLFEEIRGPAIGQLYDLVLFLIAAFVLWKLAAQWTPEVRVAAVGRISRDRDVLAVTTGWAVLPTVILALASIVHPIFSARYVAASAPGLALLVSFVCVRVFPSTFDRVQLSDRVTRKPPNRALQVFCALAVVALVVGFVAAASGLQEDLKTPARYVAQHMEKGDVFAVPDHAITAAVDYYTANDGGRVIFWPQLGSRQPLVEGLDLSLHPSKNLPRRVWLLSDGSVPVVHFESVLLQVGYRLREIKRFNGSELLLYDSTPFSVVVAPTSGATLSGKELLFAIVPNHLVHVDGVQFVFKSGSSEKVIGTASRSYFGWFSYWDTAQVPNGTYTLQSVATNTTGSQTYSSPIVVKVHN